MPVAPITYNRSANAFAPLTARALTFVACPLCISLSRTDRRLARRLASLSFPRTYHAASAPARPPWLARPAQGVSSGELSFGRSVAHFESPDREKRLADVGTSTVNGYVDAPHAGIMEQASSRTVSSFHTSLTRRMYLTCTVIISTISNHQQSSAIISNHH